MKGINPDLISKTVILFDIDGTIVCQRRPFVTNVGIRNAITSLSLQGYTLGIYSQGFRIIQVMKLIFHGLYKNFDRRFEFIGLNKIKLLERNIERLKDKRVIVIDNESSKIEQIVNLNNPYIIPFQFKGGCDIESLDSLNDFQKLLSRGVIVS